jgi:sterol desaturase/sphingolipid hydroxylase (fatty acid hydroxylase superfamily)
MQAYLTVFMAPAVVLILIAWERKIRAPQTDWRINLQVWALNFWCALTIYSLIPIWKGPALIDGRTLPVWIAAVLYFLVYDLAEYLFHRMQHRIPVLWAMHSMHHSDPNMSVLTTYRHYWADPLFKSLTVWWAAAFIISPTPVALAVYGAIGLWNLFVHSQVQFNLGRWSWLINTPAYHRRHHSSMPEHYDSNFAAILPIWDVLSGGYNVPDGFPPTGFDTRPRNIRELIAWPLHYNRAETSPAE